MPQAKNPDLHGNAPDKSDAAILIIDVINDLEFPEGERMLPQVLEMADAIARLRKKAKTHRIPVVYVNDNFGRWKSNFRATIEHVIGEKTRGAPVARKVLPGDDDYFVLKPKNSGFYSTTLEILLEYLGTRNLILTGLATNSCILFTANEAYVRDYRIYVPRDCVVGHSEAEHEYALDLMKSTTKADVRPSTRLDLAKLSGRKRPRKRR